MQRTTRTNWQIIRLAGVSLAGVLALGLGNGAEEKSGSAPAVESSPAVGKDHAATSPNPLKQPLALVARAKAAYAKVRDYSCTLVKREMVDGKLSANHVITFQMRTAPFSVSMLWQEPKEMKGQEVCYVAGKNDGEMRVKSAGLLGAIGFVSLSPDDERARQTSKHRITDAGIGWLIDEFSEGWKLEQKLNLTQVRVGAFQYAKRRCTRVELVHTGKGNGKLRHYRNVVYFDQQTCLPIRVESYDWPKKPGDPGELVEVFSYINLRLNIDLPDSAFVR